MKKKLLFVIDSLDIAGAEKSLVTLLGLLDYSKYEADLQLFAHGNLLEPLVPPEVNILEPLKYTKFSKLNLTTAFIESMTQFNFSMLFSRIKYSYDIRKETLSNPQKARMFWQNTAKVIEENEKEYDVAISYAQGVPTFYVAEKVNAKKKFAWVNASYHLKEKDQLFQKKYYEIYDQIIAVSSSAKEILQKTFPDYSAKMEVLHDINDPELIAEMAEVGKGYEDDFDGIRILTVGRLAHQKGYDIALEACKQLKDEGINFRWYVLGKGPLLDEIEEKISELNLQKHFILLGVTTNPYPYFKNADIYVQTSSHEGFGLAIAEARMLNVPVVTSNFDAVYSQMIDGKNGLVVKRNAKDISNAIKKIIQDHKLREEIIHYLQHEKKGNVEDIEKFYQIIS